MSDLPEKRAYTIGEFCRLYSVSRPTLYRLFRTGRLAYVQPFGRRLILREEGERWINSSGGPALSLKSAE